MESAFRQWAVTLVCALAGTWAVLIVAAPWLAASRGPGPTLSAGSYVVGGLLCHQRAERSFHLAGAQLPVCARCTALYLAGALGLLCSVTLSALGRREPVAKLAHRVTWRPVLAAAAFPLLATIALEWVGLWSGSNGWRAAASVPAAWAVAGVIAESLSFRVRL